jgi:peptide chain release factor 2
MEEQLTRELITNSIERCTRVGKYLEIESRMSQVAKLEEESNSEEFWNNNQSAQVVLKKIKDENKIIKPWQGVNSDSSDMLELFDLASDENDKETIEELKTQYIAIQKEIDHLEFICKLSGEDDGCNAIITIHAGAGGTESCDWAEMLYRMYSRWIERQEFKATVLDVQSGESAGIKSVSIEVEGDYAYGHLKAEGGVHRLVRISPFDSSARRHTSFASVYAYPVFDDVDDFELEEKDIRVDTYRASGAGGQHVNKTDSAVRMTHIPTNVVVQCQNQRSQIKNRASAIKMLKSRVRQFYKEEQEKLKAEKMEDKKKIEWGSQIRSYVLHPYNMVKDHRTGVETSNTQAVLDGDINQFIETFLLQFQ